MEKSSGILWLNLQNIQVKGLDSVKTTLMNMISILRKQAKIELNDINTIYLSLSGAGRELEKT